MTRRTRAILLPGALLAGCLGDLPLDELDPERDARPPAAAPLETWPADGTWGVPPTLPLAVARFPAGAPDPLPRVSLHGPEGDEVPARVEERACEALGLGEGRCVALEPTRELAGGAAHRLVASGEAATCEARFATAASATDAVPARWLDVPCALDEARAGPGCALSFERRVLLRLRNAAPVRLTVRAGTVHRATVAPRGDAAIAIDGLPPNAETSAELEAVDLAGHATVTPITLRTTGPLPRVFITEVRADAGGPEPAQEYVEVVNSEPMPVDLHGFALADAPDREGDVVGHPAWVPSGARALLVPSGFDPDHPDDAPVPAGAQLIRLDGSLGSGGLANGGEPVLLRDPAGRRVSGVPALAAPGAGVCLVRASEDGRTDAADAFAPDARGGCTPGLPDRVP
ncbi:MAG: lamin tail domain-containing protein [Myxococcota bacterium]